TSTRKALDRAFKKTNQAVLSADMDVTLSGSSCVSVLIKDSKIAAESPDTVPTLGTRGQSSGDGLMVVIGLLSRCPTITSLIALVIDIPWNVETCLASQCQGLLETRLQQASG
ncbi:hypothetical protein FOZ63_015020, partial [Perkinsus olseni]